MIQSSQFPRLTGANHRITSPATPDYNCVAWAANDQQHWWQPGVYWPTQADAAQCGIAALQAAFEALGFEPCADGSLEPGILKIALFSEGLFYTHAARQLESGKWTSKLGRLEDIEHDQAGDVADGVYGALVLFMRRKRTP
jgi:hypothetical protein